MSQSGKYSIGGGGSGTVATLTGNSGGAVGPSGGGNINVIGSGSVSVAGNPGTNTLTISVSGGGGGITTLDGDSGSATGSTVTIAGGANITTSATGATVTVDLDNRIDLPATDAAQTEGIIAFGGNNVLNAYNDNIFVGRSGNTTLTLGYNVGVGNDALISLTSGTANMAVGGGALGSLTTGNGNVGVGVVAGQSLNTGDGNICIGAQSLGNNTSGLANMALGPQALLNLTTGSNNVAFGYLAGQSYTSSESDNIVFKNDGVIGESGVIRIGTSPTHTSCFIAGIQGVTPALSPQMVTIGTDGEMGSQALPSSGITTLAGDSGSATGSTVTIAGGSNLTTAATGSTVTVDLDNTVSISGSFTAGTGITATTGNIVATAGQVNAGTSMTAGTALTVSAFGRGMVRSSSAGALSSINGTNGQVLIAATGADPAWASLTAGSNITLTPGANSLTIAASGGGSSFTWQEVTGTSQAMAVNNGYILNNASLVTATLPATAAVGDVMEIVGKGAGGWSLAQNSGQTVHFGNQDTTTGVGGSLSSTNRYDCIAIICTTANTDFVIKSSIGNLTVV